MRRPSWHANTAMAMAAAGARLCELVAIRSFTGSAVKHQTYGGWRLQGPGGVSG